MANGTGAIADFSTLNITANATVTLDGARTVGTLRFPRRDDREQDWIAAPGTGGPLTLDVATSGTASIVVLNRTATISVPITGNDGITASGAGVLVLSGANTFTGQLIIASGATVNAGVAAVPPTTGAITSSPLGLSGAGNETVVQTGGTFNVNGFNLGSGEESGSQAPASVASAR